MNPIPIELLLVDLEKEERDEHEEDNSDEEHGNVFDANEFEQSQLEARVMANKIKSMITERVPIFNPKTGKSRPVYVSEIS